MEQPLRPNGLTNHDQISATVGAAASSNTAIGVRDAAILTLMCAAGLRHREIRALNVCDFSLPCATLRIRQPDGYLRTVVLSPGAAMILGRWLQVSGLENGALFYCFRGMARTGRRRMSESAVAAIFRNWIPREAEPRMILCGDWSRTCCCPWVMGFDLVPIDYPAFESLQQVPALPPAAPAARYLAQLDSQRRRKCIEALQVLLRALGRPSADVFRYPWGGLTYAEFRRALDALPQDFALRTRIRKSLTGVLTQAFREGEISMSRFDELCGWSWRTPKESEA